MLYRTELCLMRVTEEFPLVELERVVANTMMPMPVKKEGEFLGYCTSLRIEDGQRLVADAMINMPESNP